MAVLDRRGFIGAASAATLLPLAPAALASGWESAGDIATLPGGFDIGGGPDVLARLIHGAVWLPAEGAIAFSDSGHNRRLMWSPHDSYRVLHEKTNGALGTMLDSRGRFIQCEWGSGNLVRIEADGKRIILADGFGGAKFNHPFDLAIAHDGTIFLADLHLAFRLPLWVKRENTLPSSGIYAITPDGVVSRVIDDIAQPGGIALSPDGKTLYVANKAAQAIYAFSVTGANLGSGRELISLKSDGWLAGPNGMTTDAHGNLYVGGPGGVWIVDHAGQRIGIIPLQTSRVTDLTFGGADLRTLFITSTVGIGYIRVERPGTMSAPVIRSKKLNGPLLVMEQVIERHDPALDRIVAPGTRIRKLVSADFLNDLGGGQHDLYGRSLEGGFWHDSQDCLLFSDIGNDRRMRWIEGKGLSLEQCPTGYTNGANLDANGLIISCESGPLHRLSRRMPDGTRVTLVDNFRGVPFCRPNDVAMHSSGDFYMTDPSINCPQPSAVYRIASDGSRIERAFEIGFANGIAFSPDERILYANDSIEQALYAYPAAPDGTIDTKARRLICKTVGLRPGWPDGISIDVAGNIYMGGEGGLWIIAPDGRHLGTIVHGGCMTNNMTFGGADRRMLYIVSWVALCAVPLLIPGKPVGKRIV